MFTEILDRLVRETPGARSATVMGFDGIEEGRFHIPAFSTVNPGVDDAADTILDILGSAELPQAAHHSVPYEIIAR